MFVSDNINENVVNPNRIIPSDYWLSLNTYCILYFSLILIKNNIFIFKITSTLMNLHSNYVCNNILKTIIGLSSKKFILLCIIILLLLNHYYCFKTYEILIQDLNTIMFLFYLIYIYEIMSMFG